MKIHKLGHVSAEVSHWIPKFITSMVASQVQRGIKPKAADAQTITLRMKYSHYVDKI